MNLSDVKLPTALYDAQCLVCEKTKISHIFFGGAPIFIGYSFDLIKLKHNFLQILPFRSTCYRICWLNDSQNKILFIGIEERFHRIFGLVYLTNEK